MAKPKRITETELILPSLFLMDLNGGSITTAGLIPKLREIMKPSGKDLEILNNRNDDKFSQKVRNLKAHNTFERCGYAGYLKGEVRITDAGKEHLRRNRNILDYLLINDFSYLDLTENLKKIEAEPLKMIEAFDENIIIQEGIKSIIGGETYGRSKLLRDYALTFFTKDKRIDCSCCSFNFSEFYGVDIGANFIEIHHVKPIFQYKGDDFIKTLKDTMANLAPVCSNCHRMIHRNWTKPLEIQQLVASVNANGMRNK